MEEAPLQDNDQTIAEKIYLAILLSFVLTLVPTTAMAIASTVLLTVLWVAAYIIRGKVTDGGLARHHMDYIIRTAWIGGLYALILTGFSSAYLIANIDYAPMQPCIDAVVSGGVGGTTEAEMIAQFQPCLNDFIAINRRDFMVSALITGAPILLFFFYRFGSGYLAVRKGAMMPKPKSWF